MNAPISISSGFFHDLSPEETVLELTAGGFTHMELGLEHADVLLARGLQPETAGRQFRSFAEDHGVTVAQGHLMTPNLCTPRGLEILKACLELFHGAGISAAVLHTTGVPEEPWEVQLQQRSDALRQLVSHIEGTDMVICLENLFSKPMVNDVTGINALIEAAGGSDHLGICLDIGHLHRCNGHGKTAMTSREFIASAGSRLKALHIHDNHGVDDDHLIPFVSKGLDWKMFMQALCASGYSGLFNLELHCELYAPMVIRRQRLRSSHSVAEYLLSEEFLHN